MQLTGEMLIGGRPVRGSAAPVHGIDPATGQPLDPPFPGGTTADVAQACALAWDAFDLYRETSLEGRDAGYHGYPIVIGDLLARLEGAAYVARGSVQNAGAVARTKRMMRRAFEAQLAGEGFSMVEVLTMCPTGWFVPTAEGPDYMGDTLGQVHVMGELKAGKPS